MRYLLAIVAVLALALPARAQGSTVQGVAPVGSPVVLRPVAIGAKDPSGNAQYALLDPAGNLYVTIAAVNTSSGTPSGQSLLLDGNRALVVQPGVNPLTDTITPTGVLASNGTTQVVIAAASSGKRNFLAYLTAYNTSTTNMRVFKLIDRVTGTVIQQCQLGVATSTTAGGTLILDMNQGAYQSSTGSALVFQLDGGTTDVNVTAGTVTK